MAFAIESTETVGDAVRRIVDEQLGKVLDDLRDVPPGKDTDAAVHSARKRFKRLRAVLRLVRDEFDDETFAAENAHFRDAGGSLGEARDAAVLVETLESLKSDVPAAAYAAARRKLVARRRAVKQRVLGAGDGIAGVVKAAEAARDRVAAWPLARDAGWRAVAPGLKRVYRDGRRAYNLADVGAHAERFHDWRKRCKDLWHQCELLEAVWPAILKPLADEFHELADLLGRDHDLAVLCDVIKADVPDAAAAIADVANARRVALQHAAHSLGAKLFAERPKAFTKRLGTYWKSWRESQAATPTEEPPAPDTTVGATDAPQEADAPPEPTDREDGAPSGPRNGEGEAPSEPPGYEVTRSDN